MLGSHQTDAVCLHGGTQLRPVPRGGVTGAERAEEPQPQARRLPLLQGLAAGSGGLIPAVWICLELLGPQCCPGPAAVTFGTGRPRRLKKVHTGKAEGYVHDCKLEIKLPTEHKEEYNKTQPVAQQASLGVCGAGLRRGRQAG